MRILLLPALLCVFSIIIMSGCNTTDEDKVAEVPENVPVEESGLKKHANKEEPSEVPFLFTHFDLDIDYSQDQDFDVDYENEHDEMEAEIKDDRGDKSAKGNAAFALLEPMFEQFTFDQNTPDEEVISEVINSFNLDDDFQEFELKVKFLDGDIKEYKMGQ
ncbi:YusW family protein [Bacillus sp. B15-48]|uniref:YusW family protein n=1 Tax=Bacillus sp. B15-48 TaxID=1548601 RepID=UPI0019401DC1|nr:YusW family protein [Bacillus sp. B15-48]MBM4763192.1 hypothetical protein [Bacillus sp. B15-48]